MIDEHTLNKAHELLEFEQYFIKNPSRFSGYAIQNSADEQRFDEAEASRYFDFKRKLNSSRLDFLHEKTLGKAQAFICASANYTAYKRAHGFAYPSLAEYHDKNVVQSKGHATLHMAF